MTISSFIMLGLKWFVVVALYLFLIWVMMKNNGHSS